MNTDNRTNEPSAEQIIEDALRNSYASGSALARLIVSDLHANGLLSEGTPSEAQIERALDGAPEPESVGELFPGTSEALDSLTSRKDKP